MYKLDDTIVAVSSPTSDNHVIVRMTGPNTADVLRRILSQPIQKDKSGLVHGSIAIDGELRIDAKVYLFLAPHSYTGEDVAEIHICTNAGVTEALMSNLLGRALRLAGPGEFTARAYLNGRMDLSQAEAVNEIVVSSNKFQLAAAEKLLTGRLAETTAAAREQLMDCLSLIEAGLDFSAEDIEFITREQAAERLEAVRGRLEHLLSGSISYESVIDLPAVGIAGAPNAGKSSLLNRLLGKPRSIVSEQRKTTRDVLTGLLSLPHCRCVLFDCAGLMVRPNNILDELAQQAAVESLQKAMIVVFGVDISKGDLSEDIGIHGLIESEALVPVATKCDLLGEGKLAERLAGLGDLFGADFLATSVISGGGLELLRQTIDEKVMAATSGRAESAASRNGIALTARHRQAVAEAIENISESIPLLKLGNDEVAAMVLRMAHQALSDIEQQHIDERILDRIFSRFCIGK
ncbi:MAG: 50S ribosome-binding GTPase [Planctomycetota bacterium]|nr:MAG: 50S ribosome-binding GTPase [Planctomycetota bacterium]